MTNEEIAARLRALADEIYGSVSVGIVDMAPAPAAPTPKIEDVRAALTALAGAKGGAAVKALLKDFSAEKLSDVATQDYAQLLEAAKWKGE